MLFRLLNVKTFATHLFLFLIIVACAAKLDTPQTESIKHLKHYSGLSVPANRDYWTNSGVNVDVGDNLLVMASGTIIYWPKSKRKHPPSGTLMVKIGDSDQMQYKSKFYKTISTPGDLKFFVPDRYHNDNTGSFRIHVFVIAKGREIYLPDILYDFAAQNPGDEAFKTQLNQLYLANISDITHISHLQN